MPARPSLPATAAMLAGALITLVLMAPTAQADDATTPAPSAPAAPADPTAEPVPTPTEPVPETGPPVATDPAVPLEPTAPVVRPSRLPLRDGAHGWRVRLVQERLAWLGYEVSTANRVNERMGSSTTAAVERFQSKFGFSPTGVVGPGTWDLLRIVAGTVDRLPAACLGQTTICVDKTQRIVRFVVRDNVVVTLDARFGFEGAATREGTFHVNSKSRDHVSSLYRTSMPFALFFSGGQAVHYSPYFARDGYNGASHGCVNLRDYKGAAWIFDHASVGTRVHVYRS